MVQLITPLEQTDELRERLLSYSLLDATGDEFSQ